MMFIRFGNSLLHTRSIWWIVVFWERNRYIWNTYLKGVRRNIADSTVFCFYCWISDEVEFLHLFGVQPFPHPHFGFIHLFGFTIFGLQGYVVQDPTHHLLFCTYHSHKLQNSILLFVVIVNGKASQNCDLQAIGRSRHIDDATCSFCCCCHISLLFITLSSTTLYTQKYTKVVGKQYNDVRWKKKTKINVSRFSVLWEISFVEVFLFFTRGCLYRQEFES